MAESRDATAVAHAVAPVGDVTADFGEGPVWDAATATILWVDIPRGHVHRTDPATGETATTVLPAPVSAAWPTASGGTLVARGGELVRLGADGGLTSIARLTEGPARINDLGVDAEGTVWAGTMPTAPTDERVGALWRIGRGRVERVRGDLRLPNGIGFSPDGNRVYLVDTLDARIWTLDPADPAGEAEVFADLDPASVPDGLAVDADGRVWVACAGEGALRSFTPDGRPADRLPTPVPTVTSCAFGGPDLDVLYLTTAPPRAGAAGHDWSGRLLETRPGAAGTTPTPADETDWSVRA
ncbi:SMP-30/gluconolactonase/LRE family protein [Agromyces sp. SYSU T0242]|uniref:SMP-30/gluconolactonase/LRE family protein n=1 Tax=Agromyces litoreus TaxID=3158561 RepID=UPI003394A05C